MLGIMIVSLVLSFGFLVAAGVLAHSRLGTRGVFWLSAAAVVPSCLCFSPSLALQSFVTLAVAILCLVNRASPRVVTWSAAGAMILSHTVIVSTAVPRLRALARLRHEYPLESVSGRLAYEVQTTEAVARPEPVAELPLSSNVEQSLVATEQAQNGATKMYDRVARRRMLAALHNRTSDEFVFAQGFGQTRMAGLNQVYESQIEVPEAGPIALAPDSEPAYDPEQKFSDSGPNVEVAGPPQPAKNELAVLHGSGVEDFLDAGRMGYVKDRDHVAGFQSHRFTKVPELNPGNEHRAEPWRVARLELVSLLKHPTPMAYVSNNLPRMDEINSIPTRPLNNFERQSLDRLRSDDDVVTDEAPDRIRMVGSLRAAKTCLDCHSVRRGQLLGALSYELVPVRPRRQKPPQEPVLN